MNKDTKLSEATPAMEQDTHQLFTSTEDLNKADPQYRDLEITVDGLNVVDIQMAGPGTWVPRFTVQISGDQGIDDVTGQRRVFLVAAEYLRAVLLNNGTGDGTTLHAFVPHANISRDDLDGDCAAAVTAANAAIGGLLALYNGVKIDESDELAKEGHYECYTKALHIVVRTVDFDLVEKTVLSQVTIDKLNAIIGEPANPTPALQELMRGKAGDINPAMQSEAEDHSFFNEALDVRNETTLFDGVKHTRYAFTLEGGGVWVYWVPEDYPIKPTHIDDLPDDVLLGQLPRKGDELHWRVLNKTTKSSVLNETKFFDGVQHKPKFVMGDEDTVAVWVPVDSEAVFDHLEDIPLDKRVLVSPETDYTVAQWRLL